jgi:colicin import membrane protein
MKSTPYYSPFDSASRTKDWSLAWIIVAVLAIHGLGLWLSSVSTPIVQTPHQKVVVKTIQLRPQPIEAPARLPPPEEKPVAILPELKADKEIAKLETAPIEEPPEPPKQPIVADPVPKKEAEKPPVKIIAPQEAALEEQLPVKSAVEKAPLPKKETEKPPVKIIAPQEAALPKKEEKKLPIKEPVAKPPAPKKTIQPAPTKKAQPKPALKVPPKPKKEPTPEQLATQAAEKARQQKIAAAEKARQEELAAAEKLRQAELAAARARQQELLAKARQSVAKLDETSNKIGTNKITKLDATDIPKQLENLQIDALPESGTSIQLSTNEVNYRDEVAYRIKQTLRLPDYGTVKIKLTLNRSGKVITVQIISSESIKNQQYAERTLQGLIFPPFGTRFGDADRYTFLITLNNDH